jgi:H+/Cl- antiporter ClcA
MFIGAAGGVALSHLPGLGLVPAAAMGIGAMTAAMLRLPLTAVLLTTLFLGSDGFSVMPLTIVAVVVAYLAANRLTPPPGPPAQQTGPAERAAAGPDVPAPRTPGPKTEEGPGQRTDQGLHPGG